MRRATVSNQHVSSDFWDFYPRSPCGERPANEALQKVKEVISIHALLAESDSSPPTAVICQSDFYPRSPCGERQHAYQLVLWVLRFLSTLSLRRATDRVDPRGNPTHISIHALLAESDSLPCIINSFTQNISIHALLAESDWVYRLLLLRIFLFLSTLSLRRATFWKK